MKDINLNLEILFVKEVMDKYNFMASYGEVSDDVKKALIKDILRKVPVVSIACNIQMLTPLLRYIHNNYDYYKKYGGVRIINEALALRTKVADSRPAGCAVSISIPQLKYDVDNFNKRLNYRDAVIYERLVRIARDLDSCIIGNTLFNSLDIDNFENTVSISPTQQCYDGRLLATFGLSKNIITQEDLYTIWTIVKDSNELYITSCTGEYVGDAYLSIAEITNMFKVL